MNVNRHINGPIPGWPYGTPDPEPHPDTRQSETWREWAVWVLGVLLLLVLALTCIGLAEAMQPATEIDRCSPVH